MNTKSRRMLLVALVLAVAFAFGGFVLSVAAAGTVNGWVADAPTGASEAYGSNRSWPMAPTDKGNEFTEWCFNNDHLVANETPLDVTKPIVLTYSCKSNVSPEGGSWVMFALATSFDGAAKMTAGFQETGNAQYRPFFYAHQMFDNRNGITGVGAPLTVDVDRYEMLANKCGAGYDEGLTTTLEIYFGAENASEGYILIDDLYVGYPNVTQAAYAACEYNAYLAISSFQSGFFRIKVENADSVADIKDYNISADISGGQVVLQDNVLWRADEGETVSFTVENIAEGYYVSSVKVGETELAAADGEYSFTMPAADTVIEVTVEEIPSMYKVSYTGAGTSVTFTGGTDIYAAGAEVRFTIRLNGAYSLVSVKVGETELTAADGVYSFTMPANDVTIEIETAKNYSAPSDQTVSNAVNGWNNEAVTSDPNYGPVVDANGSSMVNEGNGYSNFVLNNSGSISSVIGFDVSQPIYLDLLVKPNGTIPGNIGWFMIGLYDDWDIMLEAGVDGYGGNAGLTELNEKLQEYLKVCFGFNYNDITSDSCALSPFAGLTMESGFTLINKFGDAWNWTEDDRGTDFDYARIEFYIGETAEDGYIKIDGVKIATPTVTQADFHDGTAYMHLMSFYSSRIQAKIYASAQLDAESDVDSRAEIVFADGTDLESLQTYDTVTFRVNVPENYGALVRVDGQELRPDADGNYTAVIGYGTSVISVSVDEMVTVSFNTGGYGSADPVTVTKGGTVSAPVLEREGYTLEWYADEAFTSVFDFTAAVSESCTVYAKWTPVDYSIAYYDGANRIRDLSPTSYNAETDTFELPTPVKEGYTFEGWFTDAAFTGEAVTSIEKGSTGDITLYAKWSDASSEGGGCSSAAYAGPATGVAALCIALVAVTAIKKRGVR